MSPNNLELSQKDADRAGGTTAPTGLVGARCRRTSPLPFFRPSIGDEEIADVAAVMRSGWLTAGPRSIEFAARFRDSVSAPDAHAVSSCTAALHVALVALGVGQGDLVYTTPITFAATVHVISQTGARAILVDVEPDTLNLDPCRLEEAIGATRHLGRPAAVLPVHFAGHPCDLAAILDVAARHDLAVVEDSAHSCPAAFRDVPIGDTGNDPRRLVAFSFYATKNLSIGEGGMLTGAPELIDRCRVLGAHGMTRDAWRRYQGGSWRYDISEAGFKYNFTDLQAAIGLQQLRRLPDLQRRRREIVARYAMGLRGDEALELPVERADLESAWHLYVLRLRLEALRIDRAGFIEELERRMISPSVHFIPIHHMTHFSRTTHVAPAGLAVADREFPRYLSLPLFPDLTDEEVDDVIEAVLDVADAFRS